MKNVYDVFIELFLIIVGILSVYFLMCEMDFRRTQNKENQVKIEQKVENDNSRQKK